MVNGFVFRVKNTSLRYKLWVTEILIRTSVRRTLPVASSLQIERSSQTVIPIEIKITASKDGDAWETDRMRTV